MIVINMILACLVMMGLGIYLAYTRATRGKVYDRRLERWVDPPNPADVANAANRRAARGQ